MPKRSDDTLVAYLDGELDSAERQHVEAWLAADAAARRPWPTKRKFWS